MDEDNDWKRAHLRVKGNGVGERDADWERAHLRVEGNGVGEGNTDWERAHLIGWVWCGGSHRLGENALESGRE